MTRPRCELQVYSFGIVLWEIASRQVPFAGAQPIQAAMAVLHRQRRPDHTAVRATAISYAQCTDLTTRFPGPELTPVVWLYQVPASCPPAFQALISACWQQRPEKRPTINQALGRLCDLQKQHSSS